MERTGGRDVREQVERLQRLAAEWRFKASETCDGYYIALMTRTAEALEAQAADLLGQFAGPKRKRSARNT